MKKIAILALLVSLILNSNPLSAQQTNSWLDNEKPVPYAKLYLHTDRDLYFQSDSIWFKAYYVDGQAHQFIDGYYNLFVELINAEGEIIQNQVIPLTYGVSSGNIKFSPKIAQGNYTIRAYTNYQRDFGEDAYFHKDISISRVKSSLELEEDQKIDHKLTPPKIDVAFLPEGGIILEDQMNIIGIKAIDEKGMGISVKGEILNQDGEVETIFATEYKGMGKIHFIPQEGETYTARILNYPDFKYQFTDIKKEGIKLEFAGALKNEFLFRITTNSRIKRRSTYYFAFMHKGAVLSYQKVQLKKNNTAIKISKDDIPCGINRLVLLDEQFKPISERLFFSKNININQLGVNSDKDNYSTRSPIKLEISDQIPNINTFSSLSVSVVDESAILANGPSTNILSYLLIDSELRGKVESPAEFFIDEKVSSDVKLDYLMLTQGWSHYIWNELEADENTKEMQEEVGMTISGDVKRIWTKKPIIDGDVVLGLFANENLRTYSGKTDQDGRFSIDSVFFSDSATIFLQARNAKGKRDTRVFFDPLFEKSPEVSTHFLPSKAVGSKLTLELYRRQYYNAMAMKAYDPAVGSIMLDEINITASKMENKTKHFKMYGHAYISWKITDMDHTYRDVFRYLEGRVAGVMVSGYYITIRGSSTVNISTQPLFLLNGMEVSFDAIRDLPMSVIDEVDVLKSSNELAIYGMRGANGVIAVYTKSGEALNYVDPFVRGAITEKIVGYAPFRAFYSPKYTAENISSERPDNRLTLYWNPNVMTQNGKASLSFFTSDDISNFKIFVEGITNDGKICLGEAEFAVNEYNESISK